MSTKEITVLMVELGQHPKVTTLEDDLRALGGRSTSGRPKASKTPVLASRSMQRPVYIIQIQVPPRAPKEKSSQSGWLFSFACRGRVSRPFCRQNA